ncbi:MAG: ATPase [Anaerolineae bacterium]
MKFLGDRIAFRPEAGQVPAGFRPLTEFPLVILVGLTGVGKSTILELLPQYGLTFTLLPNRREVTDDLIIALLQAEAGETPHPVKDRIERFEYTARYREKYPGGMAHALSRLLIEAAQSESLFIFDGLRGLNEVQHAAAYFSQARFVVLDAPDTVRLNRLLQRGDLFDTAGSGLSPSTQSLMETLQSVPHVTTIFSPEQLAQIARNSEAAQIPADEVVQKLSIIVKERRNYDSGAARAYLVKTLPPERVLVVDTSTQSAEAAAQKVAVYLR